MVKLLLGVLPVLLSLAQNPARMEDLADNEGMMAIYIDLAVTGQNVEFNEKHLRSCLNNHLDHYLWSKGWTFEFVYPGTNLSLPEVKRRLAGRPYRRLMYIETEAEFKTRRYRMVTGDNSTAKMKYPGVLKMKLSVSFHDLKSPDNAFEAGTFSSKSENNWVESPPGRAGPVMVSRPEPADFVLKRLLSQALDFLPPLGRPEREVETEIPVKLLIDARVALADSAGEMEDIHAAVEYASELLRRQFGYSLEICDRRYFATKAVPLTGTDLVFRTLLETEPAVSDTITLAVFKPDSAEQFYLSYRTLQVGLSDVSRQILLIADLSIPNRATRGWKAFLNGQLLLHEIGHLFGAVHVSDINSVMTPRAAWVSSGRFDSLNADIIRTGRTAGVPSMRVAEYVEFIADAIKSNAYKLSDYPQVFFSHINLNREQFQDKSFGDGGVGKAIPFAERGYRRYLMKDYETARNLFYMALVCDSTQGAVHYYLSKVTSGKLAELHLKKSSEQGFYRATNEIAAGDDD